MKESQEMVYIKTKTIITQTLLSTKFPFWLNIAMLDSIRAELLDGLYRNSLLGKEVNEDATSRSAEQHNEDVEEQ